MMKPADNNLNLYAERITSDTEPVGLIQKIFGNGGELVVKTRETFPEDYTEPLWVNIDSMAVPLFINSFAPQGLSKAVIVFDDFESKERATILTGRELFSGQRPTVEEPPDWSFLTGYSFEDDTSGLKGAVADYIDNSLNPLLEVETESGRFLVPFSEDLTRKINKRKKLIVMSLPEGIFEL